MLSLGLSVLGLLLATLSPPRQRQIAQAVVFALILFISFVICEYVTLAAIILASGTLIDSQDFWIANLAWLTFYVNAFAIAFLFYSLLTTVCQNRSTALAASR